MHMYFQPCAPSSPVARKHQFIHDRSDSMEIIHNRTATIEISSEGKFCCHWHTITEDRLEVFPRVAACYRTNVANKQPD
jgi:hypothetical protein